MSDVEIYIERISSLHRSLMRQAVSKEGLQLVHFEVMQYLTLCNRYSNTAQALCEYLGQTKGSISQTLSFLETNGYVERKEDSKDRRYARLSLTTKGRACFKRMNADILPDMPENDDLRQELEGLLQVWQKKNGQRSFGQCGGCKFNQKLGGQKFRCGLTGEDLSLQDTQKICREHTLAA